MGKAAKAHYQKKKQRKKGTGAVHPSPCSVGPHWAASKLALIQKKKFQKISWTRGGFLKIQNPTPKQAKQKWKKKKKKNDYNVRWWTTWMTIN